MKSVRIALSFVLWLFSGVITAYAQQIEVTPWEAEISVGLGGELCKVANDNSCGTFEFGLSFRRNIKKVPVAVGLDLRWLEASREEIFQLSDGESYISYNGGGIMLGPSVEYVFRRGRKLAYVTSLGTGVKFKNASERTAPYIRPAVAIEFINHLRLGVAVTVADRPATSMTVTLGVVIGGGRRR